VQIPETQVPSEHDTPSGLEGIVHAPIDGSQTPNSWHSSAGVHSVVGPTQTPPWQMPS
jgi:hypothetical protein